jgi:manganese-dependent inorganic pyrophosphatase
MDSVCSAYAYAALKNRIDTANSYVPVRCGNLNDATKAAFERIGVAPPSFIKDVRCRLSCVVRRGETTLDWQDPVYKLVSLFENKPSAVCVMKDGNYYGLLTIDEVNRFFLKENSGVRPLYHFVVDNIPKVLRGRFIRKGDVSQFDGPILVGAMRYVVFCQHLDALERPLLVVGDREEHIKKAVEEQVPCIILTGLEHGMTSMVDFSSFHGTVFVSEEDTSETIRLLRLSVPIDQLMDEHPPILDEEMLFDEAKNTLSSQKFRGMPVFKNDEWKGFVTRRCFLEKPKTKVILVDHNEPEQSVPGIDEAELVEIIDHHRLGTLKTPNPIYIFCDPVGSTCTIVYTLYRRFGLSIPKDVAGVLLSGLVSDTVMLKSPTTTAVDREAASTLAGIYGVSDLSEFGTQLFSSGASLEGKDPQKLVESDFKMYKENGKRFGIGQCEVTTLGEVEETKGSFFTVLSAVREKNALDFALFLITDVIHENSILLCSGLDAYEPKLAYQKQSEHTLFLPGVLSRKKQLLPEVLRVLEEN